MRFTDIDVNFDVQIWRSSKLPKNTFYEHFEGFSDHHVWRQNWPLISVNLIMSIYFFLWTSSIVQVFDFLTFDIFLTTWHLLTFWHITWTISAHHWLGAKVGSRGTCDQCPIPLYPIVHVAHTPVPIAYVAHILYPYPCTLLPHVPLLLMLSIPLYPIATCAPITHMADTHCTYPCTPLPPVLPLGNGPHG